ncbi:MAG TPA: hypothetical protein VIX82_18040 [Solirubrobacteraceae bacterium]
MRRVASTAVAGVMAGGFYLLLIDTTDLPELYGLSGVAVVSGAAYHVSRRQHLGDASIAPVWLVRTWRPVSRVPSQILVVCIEAFSQLLRPRARRGEFRAVPFRGGDGERDVGRRALAEAFGSLAPNTIIIGVDSERNLLLVHQLRRAGGHEELDVLGLG